MKQFLVAIFSVLLIFALTACNNGIKGTDSSISDLSQDENTSRISSTQKESDNANKSFESASNKSNNTNNNINQPTNNIDGVSSTTTITSKDTISYGDISDLHDIAQSQNSTPEVSTDFKPITDDGFSGGNGTQSNPYLITTSEELVYLSEKINSGKMNNGVYFALGADIDMTGVEFLPIGNGTNRFSSNFDGRGFTVSNLSPKLLYDDYGNNANYSCGFFGIVGNAEIKNLHLENVKISYTYESNYFTEIGLLAGCVYPTRECKITDCIVNGSIKVETDVLLAGGIVGDIFVTDNAKLKFERLQTNTNIQVRGDSIEAGAISGSVLGRGEESFSDIFVESEILHSSVYYSHIGAFGGVANTKGSINVSNCFIKINTNAKHGDEIHPLIGGIIDSYQPSGKFDFMNVFGCADSSTELYEIPSENPVKEENCSFTNVLPANCNFNTEIWDIAEPSAPSIKFNFQKN